MKLETLQFTLGEPEDKTTVQLERYKDGVHIALQTLKDCIILDAQQTIELQEALTKIKDF